jgi:ubiquitin-protein ligase
MVNYLTLIHLRKTFWFLLGEVCIDVLSQDGIWTAATTLDAAVIEVTKLIDNPRIDRVAYPG